MFANVMFLQLNLELLKTIIMVALVKNMEQQH